MRILHVLPRRGAAYGGPVAAAELIHRHSKSLGFSSEIRPRTDKDPITLFGTLVYWPGWRELHHLGCAVSNADIVHLHGLWTIPIAFAAFKARRLGIPYVITPHGMLDHWSLERSRHKKLLYGWLVERRNLKGAAALHFLNEGEYREAQDFGLSTPGFIVPNGVEVDRFKGLPGKEALGAWLPETRGRTVVLFLGRLEPKKGLDVLLPAFGLARRRDRALHLLIAGPSERGYRSKVERWIDELDLSTSVSVLGLVSGYERGQVLGGSDLFVLSSHEEGDPVAVKEAMASGLPVVITPQCRLPDVATHSAGMVVEPNVTAVGESISVLAQNARLRKTLGDNAARLAAQYYRADRCAEAILGVYFDIISNRIRPLNHGVRESIAWV